MAESFGPAQIALSPGRQEWFIDARPNAKGVELACTNAGWPAGAIALLEVFYSLDGGLTFTGGGVSATLTAETPPPSRGRSAHNIIANFPTIHGKVRVPTHCRGAITLNKPVTAAVSLRWL